jgi:hypothetical protein
MKSIMGVESTRSGLIDVEKGTGEVVKVDDLIEIN